MSRLNIGNLRAGGGFRVVNTQTEPRTGYYCFKKLDELVAYLKKCVEKWKCAVFTVHGAGYWHKGDETEFIHGQPLGTAKLDIDQAETDDFWELYQDALQNQLEDGAFQVALTGSGWVLDKITLFLMKIAPYRESNVNVNHKTVTVILDPTMKISSFHIALALAFSPWEDGEQIFRKDNIRKKATQKTLRSWLFAMGINAEEDIHFGQLSAWHEKWGKGNIRVWNERGNVLYERGLSLDAAEGAEWADLYYAPTRRWHHIENLAGFHEQKRNKGRYCKVCVSWHHADNDCKTKEINEFPPEPELVKVTQKWGNMKRFAIYADLEAIMTPDGPHIPACYAFVLLDSHTDKIITKKVVSADEVEGDLMKDMMKKIYSCLNYLQRGSDGEQELWEEEFIFEEPEEDPVQQTNNQISEYKRQLIHDLCERDNVDVSFFEDELSVKRRKDWNEKKGIDCATCGKKINVLHDKPVEGRSYINGVWGHHHEDCWNHPDNCVGIYFHNGKGYDLHHLLRAVLTSDVTEKPVVFAKGVEKLDSVAMTNRLIRINFLDTMNFLLGSLDRLVKTVTNFIYTPEDERNAKLAFPYYWFDDMSKLHAPAPPENKQDYWNMMRLHYEDMQVIQGNYQKHGFQQFKEYVKYYNLLDVLQLADVFENFRKVAHQTYGADPGYFMGTPGYTWWVAIMNSIPLKTSPEAVIPLIQQHIRGGVAQVMHGYYKVENPGEYLLALDVNSLYSFCLAQRLPTKYIGEGEGDVPIHEEWGNDTEMTYIAYVDLEYPKELHDRDWMYPLAPEHSVGKLLTTFWKKEKYLCTADELQYYVQRGLKITKTHAWWIYTNMHVFADYVEGNIARRVEYTREGNKMGAELMKLMNNSLYGRCIMNPAKFTTLDIFKGANEEEENYEENRPLMTKGDWYSFETEDDDVVFLVQKPAERIQWKYPNHIGFGVLGHAKIHIYRMIEKLQATFGDDLQLHYTDTDSLTFSVTQDPGFPHPYQMLEEKFPGTLDLDYDWIPSNVKRTPGTVKRLGLWSDDYEGKIAKEFVGLRAKCYAVRFEDGKEKLKGKGVNVTTATLTWDRDEDHVRLGFEHYLECLKQNSTIYTHTEILRRKGDKINTIGQRKLTLSMADSKRLVFPDGINRLPFGYEGTQFPQYSGKR